MTGLPTDPATELMAEMRLKDGSYRRVMFNNFRMDSNGQITTLDTDTDSPYKDDGDDLINYKTMAFSAKTGDKNYPGW